MVEQPSRDVRELGDFLYPDLLVGAGREQLHPDTKQLRPPLIDRQPPAPGPLVPREEVAPLPEEQELVDFLVYRPQPSRRAFRVFRTESGFRVTGRPPAPEQLEAILKAAGAREGDEVEVGEETLEWG